MCRPPEIEGDRKSPILGSEWDNRKMLSLRLTLPPWTMSLYGASCFQEE